MATVISSRRTTFNWGSIIVANTFPLQGASPVIMRSVANPVSCSPFTLSIRTKSRFGLALHLAGGSDAYRTKTSQDVSDQRNCGSLPLADHVRVNAHVVAALAWPRIQLVVRKSAPLVNTAKSRRCDVACVECNPAFRLARSNQISRISKSRSPLRRRPRVAGPRAI